MNLRVWWSNNFGQRHFKVDSVEQAKKLINELGNIELKDNSISWNASGLEELENGEWVEYYNEDGLDIKDIMLEEEL